MRYINHRRRRATTTYGLEQLISDPTHILLNSVACTKLIFTDQSNLVVDSRAHPHYTQIFFTK